MWNVKRDLTSGVSWQGKRSSVDGLTLGEGVGMLLVAGLSGRKPLDSRAVFGCLYVNVNGQLVILAMLVLDFDCQGCAVRLRSRRCQIEVSF